MKILVLGILVCFSFLTQVQTPIIPTPPTPGEQSLDGPQAESKTPITKQTPDEKIPNRFRSKIF